MKRLSFAPLLFLAACAPSPPTVQLSKTTLIANGYDQAVVVIQGPSQLPTLGFLGDSRYTRLSSPYGHDKTWTSTLTASVNPGLITIRIQAPGSALLTRTLTLLPQTSDSASDGTPDFLRLDNVSDQAAFSFWFTFLAEVQYFNKPRERPIEISDCSALLRYAYREALRDHNASWSSGVHLPFLPAFPSINKYSFPHTPVGANIFRNHAGSYSPADLADGKFSQFANAETIRRFNSFFISRDVRRAQPGDLLFFRRNTTRITYHSMIFVGPSQVNRDTAIYVVYHTGPEGTNAGEIRRLTLNQLLQFPDPQWHPIAANPSFLGIYRWNILKALS